MKKEKKPRTVTYEVELNLLVTIETEQNLSAKEEKRVAKKLKHGWFSEIDDAFYDVGRALSGTKQKITNIGIAWLKESRLPLAEEVNAERNKEK